MPRLPDIGINDWLEDQQKRFYETTAGLFPSLEFQLGTKETESQIPLDYDAPGGRDQWQEAEQSLIERQNRLAQQQDEDRQRQEEEQRQQEIQAMAEQFRQQQAEAEAQQREQELQRQQAVQDQIRSLGIPTPADAFADVSIGEHQSSMLPQAGSPEPSQEQPTGSPVDQFNQFASGLQGDLFGGSGGAGGPPSPPPPPEPPRDDRSTTGIFDQLGSAIRQGGQAIHDTLQSAGSALDQGARDIEASTAYQTLFPARQERTGLPDTPQNVLLDPLGAARRGVESGARMVEEYGVGRTARNLNELAALEDEIRASEGSGLTTAPSAAWRAANPEKAARYDELVQEREGLVMGASGTMGGGGLADDAINAIKTLWQHGLDDAARAAEQNLAQKTRMTLEEIAQRTRGVPPEAPAAPTPEEQIRPPEESIPGGPLTPEERALNEAADARARAAEPHAGYLEDPTFGVEEAGSAEGRTAGAQRPTPAAPSVPSESSGPRYGEEATPAAPLHRGLTPQEAIQQRLPGFEHLTPEERPPGQGVRGFGTLPRSLEPGPVGVPQESEDVLRQLSEENRPVRRFTRAEAEQKAAELLEMSPDEVHRRITDAPFIDPADPAVTQTMLKENTRYQLGQWERARVEFAQLQQEIDELRGQHPEGKLDNVPAELLAHYEYASAKLGTAFNDLQQAFKGQSLHARASSRVLNAQKGGLFGRAYLSEANIVQNVSESLKKAKEAVQRAARGEQLDEGALREAGNKLKGRQSRRAITGESNLERDLSQVEQEAGSTPGGPGRRTPGQRTAQLREPGDETLAEKLGRLKREQARYQDQLDQPGRGLPEAERGTIRDEITRLRDEIETTLQEARDDAVERARQTIEGRKAPLTAEEAERLVNQQLGQRTISKIRREELARQKGYWPKDVRDLASSLENEFRKAYQNEQKLLDSIDTQVQRRVDQMLATERRAQVRQEVGTMAKEARILTKEMLRKAGTIGNKASQHNEEQLDLVFRRMSDHSNTGAKIAGEMRERFWDQMGRRLTRLEEQGYQAGQRQISRDTISSIVQQIDDVLKNPHGPDRMARLQQLYADLEQVSEAGLKRASGMRQRAVESGLAKPGQFQESVDKDMLAKLMATVNPDDPNTFKPILAVMKNPGLWDYWREISFLNMLSSPMTHAWNIGSTSANMALRLLIRNPAEFLGSGGELSGVGAAFRGLASGAKEGGRLAATTLKTGINPQRLEDAVAKGDFTHVGRELMPELLAKGWGTLGAPIGQRERFARFGGKLGEAMHLMSTRPLEAADAMMGNMMYASAAAQGAQRKADALLRTGKLPEGFRFDPGLRIPEREQLAQHIMNNLWDHMDVMQQAGKIQDYTLFRSRDKNRLESGLRQLMAVKNLPPNPTIEDILKSAAVDFIMPFYNVPMNFMKQGVGNIVGAPRGAVGMIKNLGSAEKQGEAAGRMVQGGLMMTIPIMLAQGDNLTGAGPTDPGDRRVWLQTHRPNSWRAPGTDTWVSYEGTPWAIPFASVAGAKEELEFRLKNDPRMTEGDRLLAGGLGAAKGFGQGVLSNSLLDGMNRNFQILTGNLNKGDIPTALSGMVSRYSPHTLIAPVPSGMANFLARVSDTVERDTGKPQYLSLEQIGDVARNQLQARIPGLRQQLPEKLGAYGEPREREGFAYSVREPDAISSQLERGSIGIPDAPAEIRFSPQTVMPLTIAEQREFQRLYGANYRRLLEAQGAGTKEMSEYFLTWLRDEARKQASEAIRVSIPEEERRRRVIFQPREVVAP